MSLFQRFLSLFRKKEFYEVSYDTLNQYSVEFLSLDESVLNSIKSVILELHDHSGINNSYFEKKHFETFSNLEQLLNRIELIWEQDYDETHNEAISNDWNFNYFLMNDPDNPEMLCLSNRIVKSNEDSGTLMYPLLVLKKVNGAFFVWNLLD